MACERDPEGDAPLVDPVPRLPGLEDTASRVAILSHPIHATAVAFPIALTFCALGADLLHWRTGDPFWARASLWAVGTGSTTWRPSRVRRS